MDFSNGVGSKEINNSQFRALLVQSPHRKAQLGIHDRTTTIERKENKKYILCTFQDKRKEILDKIQTKEDASATHLYFDYNLKVNLIISSGGIH